MEITVREFLQRKNYFPSVLKNTLSRHYNTLQPPYIGKYFEIL